ncbi:uridine monophosphate kinase [Syntrophomonas wolfei]|jgi:molybdenum storage protein|uniref:Uridylate kinase n=3 Tax=Syntrophomonas wolfei TaxID=863 RepID=Q0AU61_SYNWW|nr:uridine monophosphate kinase [Syntrophomonas wolfei]ABI69743.1 uridylate kinase [Syntrophomonas wolfei subsp. wolfei str. Goettingen G311]
MPLIRERDSKRLHVKSKLMGESLVGKGFLKSLEYGEQFRALPNVNVVKMGGQSITDRGARAVLPLIKEIVENARKHKMIISTGGGTRSRHVYAIAMELGMPTGIISKLGQSVSEQNSLMISTLLSPYGGIKVGHDDIPKLAAFFMQGCIPVIHGMPPYGYWEHLPREGRIPPNRTDVGAYLLAEVIGARQCIFIKDEEGLFSDNPKVNKQAEFIPRIGAQELLNKDLEDLVVERAVLEMLVRSQSVKEIQIINGLKEGNLSRALNGEHIGTIIYKDI